jgi:hypothetical protein
MAVERHGRKAIYTKAFNEAFTRVARHKGHTYFDDRARNAPRLWLSGRQGCPVQMSHDGPHDRIPQHVMKLPLGARRNIPLGPRKYRKAFPRGVVPLCPVASREAGWLTSSYLRTETAASGD